jgi:tetratricopeptide (TPR) repeat protein
VKEFPRYSRVLGAALIALSAENADAQSSTQSLRPGQQPGPRFLVPVLRSTDKALGLEAGNVIRERLMGDYMANQLYIVPKQDIDLNLEASGYSKTEALTQNDLKQLAPTVRAEEYLDGVISRPAAGASITLKATLNLLRPPGMVQPLPEVSDPRVGGIARLISAEIDKARKQIPETRKCLTAAQARQYDQALAAAQKAIAAYPRAVFARVCMLEVANSARMGPDSILKFATQILEIYPENSRALALAADAYNEKNMDDKYVESMLKMLSADPSNASLQERVVAKLGEMGKPDMAKPIIDEAVKQNPGDPQLVRLQWAIYRAMKIWKEAAVIGEEMIKTDTSAADTTFFKQLVGVYVADSQFQKAGESAARGASKFPRNATLWLTHAQLARQTGQLPQALNAINKTLEIDPKFPQAAIMKVTILRDLNLTDSMVVAVREAVAEGEDKATMGALALSVGNAMYQAFAKDSNHTLEQGDSVIAVLAYADTLAPSNAASFLMGATKVTMGQMLLGTSSKVAQNAKSASQADKDKACEEARRAQTLFVDAGPLIQKGGREFPQQAGALMQAQMQLAPYTESVMKVVCPKR